MQRNQCLELEERVDSAVRDVLAKPAAEQSSEALLEALNSAAGAMRAANRRWKNVLRVQIAMFFFGGFMTIGVLRARWQATLVNVAELLCFSLWPIVLSVRAIWHMNHAMEEVPRRLVRHRVFDQVK